MLRQIQSLSLFLGSYEAAAGYLGYSARHLYNIRKRLEDGKLLHKRVETHITQMINQLGRKNKSRSRRNHQ